MKRICERAITSVKFHITLIDMVTIVQRTIRAHSDYSRVSLQSLREFKNNDKKFLARRNCFSRQIPLLHTLANPWRSRTDLSMLKYFNPPRASQTEKGNRFENNKHPGVNLNNASFCTAKSWRAGA